MQLKVESASYLAELRRRSERLAAYAGSPLGASIVVPDSMSWWYIQEFGTVGFYPIDPVNAEELVFPDPSNYGEEIHALHVNHPPVKARYMVNAVLDDIRDVFINGAVVAMFENQFDAGAVRARLMDEIMPAIKDIITQSFAERLPGTRVDGRLMGRTAADAFDAEAEIVEHV